MSSKPSLDKILFYHLIEFALSKDPEFYKFINSNYSLIISHIELDALLKQHKLDLRNEEYKNLKVNK